MNHLIKAVSALFIILALYSGAYAQNKVVVIPLGGQNIVSGVTGVTNSTNFPITTTTATSIASVTISESGTFDVALNAHATVEIAGTSNYRFVLEIRNSTCTGTVLGQAMWRPGGADSNSTLYANTISLTGFQANVVGPETYVLCARKFDAGFPDALVFFRGLNLSYSN